MKRAFAQIHLAVLLWGFTGILGKAISLSAPVLVWYRMALAALIIALIITIRREWYPMRRRDLVKVVGIGSLFAIHWVAFYASVKLANASIAMICLATSSVFTAVLDPLFNKRKSDRSEILIGLLAVSGVALIYFLQPAQVDHENPMHNFELGLAFGIIASVLSAVFTVFNKPLAVKYPARQLVFGEMGSGMLFLSLLAPIYLLYFPQEVLTPKGWDYLWIFLLAYCCTVWAQALAMAALRKLSPFTVTLSVNLEPVYGIILAFLIFQENAQLGFGFYVGMGLVFLSLMLQTGLALQKARRNRRGN